MKQAKKNQTGGSGSPKTVHRRSSEQLNSSKFKPPRKAEAVILAFLKFHSLNTFEATSEYGDTCLHTSVSDLIHRHGIQFDKKSEPFKTKAGTVKRVTRYTPKDLNQLKALLKQLRIARGVEVNYEPA